MILVLIVPNRDTGVSERLVSDLDAFFSATDWLVALFEGLYSAEHLRSKVLEIKQMLSQGKLALLVVDANQYSHQNLLPILHDLSHQTNKPFYIITTVGDGISMVRGA